MFSNVYCTLQSISNVHIKMPFTFVDAEELALMVSDCFVGCLHCRVGTESLMSWVDLEGSGKPIPEP